MPKSSEGRPRPGALGRRQVARPVAPSPPVQAGPPVRADVPPAPGQGGAPHPEVGQASPARKPGFLARHWPGPGPVAPPAVLIAMTLAGLVAAASLPLDRPGIGWLLTGVGAAVATSAVSRVAGPFDPPLAVRVRRVAWGTATIGLLAVGTVRAAGWLFVLCVLTACVTGSLSVGGGSTVAGMIRGGLAVPFAALRALPWCLRGLAALRGRSGVSPVRVAATVAVTAVLLLVFGGLLASADAAFAELLRALLPEVGVGTVVRWGFVFCTLALGTLGAAYLVAAPPEFDGAGAGRVARLARLEWALPLGLLNLLFTGFVLVQLTVLFGGAAHVLRNAGLTYAEYARRGFWQLLAVTVLTLAVLAAAARWAPRDSRTDRVLVRALLGALAALTLVVVVSALYRMSVYEKAYGYTRLRIFVQVVEVWLGVVFVLVLAAGVRLRAAWLPRAVGASAVAALLALAALNPDRLIAERNVDRYQAGGDLDVAYLATLSADAVPTLDRLDGLHRDCALRTIGVALRTDPDDWREFNLARRLARDIVAADQPPPTVRCGW